MNETQHEIDRAAVRFEAAGRSIVREVFAQQTKHRRRKYAALFVIFLIASAIVLLMPTVHSIDDLAINQDVMKKADIVGAKGPRAHVAFIPIETDIGGDFHGPPDVNNTPRYINDTLEIAKKEKNLAAVIFYINSLGGGADASTQGYRLISAFRKEHKDVHVYAYVSQGAYSGGYFLALGAGEIVADPTAVVGNIGVIETYMNKYRLGKWLGVEEYTIKTGPQKDIGHQWRKYSKADRAMMQRGIDATFSVFLRAVSESRNIPYDTLLAEVHTDGSRTSGSWFGAEDAKSLKLIDRIVPVEHMFDMVIDDLKQTKKYGSAEFVRYDKKVSTLDNWKKGSASLGETFVRGMRLGLSSSSVETKIQAK